MEDLSLRSIQPLPELSLGSLNSSSSFNCNSDQDDSGLHLDRASSGGKDTPATSTPSHLNLKTSTSTSASASSPSTAPLATPANSPPQRRMGKKDLNMVDQTPMPIRRVLSQDTDSGEGDETALETPVKERTQSASFMQRTSSSGTQSQSQSRKSRTDGGEGKPPTS